MKKIDKILRERVSGLFLLLFSVLIITGVSWNSHGAESRNEQSLASEERTSSKGQILGEADSSPREKINENNSVPRDEIIKENALENESQANINNANSEKQKKAEISKKKPAKKSKKHKKPSKESNDSSINEVITTTDGSIPSTEAALTLDFIINSGGETKKFSMEFNEGETVYELMKEAKVQGRMTYEKNTDETYGVYINAINGLKEGLDVDWTKNKYWILYVSGKSSSLGCSSHKLTKLDTSVEWKYEKYSF